MTFRFTVNGAPVEVEATGTRRLLDVLREDLALTGTKEGCGEGECGACSVLLDGAVVDACLVPVSQAAGTDVRTVEDIHESLVVSPDGPLGPYRRAKPGALIVARESGLPLQPLDHGDRWPDEGVVHGAGEQLLRDPPGRKVRRAVRPRDDLGGSLRGPVRARVSQRIVLAVRDRRAEPVDAAGAGEHEARFAEPPRRLANEIGIAASGRVDGKLSVDDAGGIAPDRPRSPSAKGDRG